MSRAEAMAASVAAAVAVAAIAAYLPYRAGWRVAPSIVLIVAIAAGAAIAHRLSRSARDGSGVAIVATIFMAVFVPLIALAWPDWLPIGGGPDLTHHLVLINYIERAWRLVDDPALYPYLGDMMDYTPGSHLLIAMAGVWTRSDGIHAAHAVISGTVALKAVLVFCITRRMLRDDGAATPMALAAVVLVFLPYEYVVGSFVTHSYWAQVVAELFAIAAWWTLVAWDDRPSSGAMALFALFGAATFITWPIWVGPIVITAVAIVVLREDVAAGSKARHLAIGLGPVAAIAVFHSIGKLGRLQMAGTSGFVIRPSYAVFGAIFLAASVAGIVWALTARRGRPALAFLGAILLQAIALTLAARARGADTPYLALKMIYLAPYPLAVAGAAALSLARRRWWPTLGRTGARDPLAWTMAAALIAALVFRIARVPRPAPIVTASALAAGRWARDHVDRACVDYLVSDGYRGYWLHLAVLDNPRDTPRFNAPDTFEPQKAVARWVESAGLPYAIVDDVNGFSRALFSGTETLAQFDRARVIGRLGRTTCER